MADSIQELPMNKNLRDFLVSFAVGLIFFGAFAILFLSFIM